MIKRKLKLRELKSLKLKIKKTNYSYATLTFMPPV